MNLPADLKVSVRRDVDLSKYCTMRIGGPARFFAEPRTEDELVELVQFAREESIPFFILGKGSNVVFADEGYSGLVITLIHFNDQDIRINRTTSEVTAASGVHLYRLALACRDAGLSGTEFLSGIPGTVGGAVMMNAGFSRFAGQMNEIGDLIREVRVLDEAGQRLTLERSRLDFSYRHSGLEGKIILEAVLQLARRDSAAVDAEIRANFEYRNEEQDLKHPSSGSIFKNPPKPLPSAGRLIDGLGLKETREGGMLVSPRHANYFINAGHATCEDLSRLIKRIQKTVFNEKGILLEPEVRIIRA